MPRIWDFHGGWSLILGYDLWVSFLQVFVYKESAKRSVKRRKIRFKVFSGGSRLFLGGVIQIYEVDNDLFVKNIFLFHIDY